MTTDVVLTIGNQQFTGWKSISITRGIEQLCGGFQLSCSDKWALSGQQTPILTGQTCSVQVKGVTVITGYIDKMTPAYSKTDHTLTIEGRDRTADLVDCAAVVDGFGVLNRTLQQVASDLCKPFGISVTVASGVNAGGAFTLTRINTGETIFEALSRLAQIRGVLLMSDGQGGLLITQAGTGRAGTSLVLGQNIQAGFVSYDISKRYNQYRVLSQTFDINSGNMSSEVIGTAIDSEIRTGRITIVDPVEPSDVNMAGTLAKWISQVRKGQSLRGSYTVKGWNDTANTIWTPNTLVNVQDAWGRLNGDYLIAGVKFDLDEDGGEITELEVVPPDAYSLIPHKESADVTFQLFALQANPPSSGQTGTP